MAVSILTITHGNVGKELLTTAKIMLGKLPLKCETLSVSNTCNPEELLLEAQRLCKKIDDGDGVLNSLDECPNTPAGAQVDSRGCEIHAALDSTHFAFDSSELTAEAQAYLNSIAASLAGKSLTAHGHTDSDGTESYNMGLSERRATSVADYLGGAGVGGVNTVGHGESDPIASNDTAEGRAMNRRVDITTASQ